MADIGEVEWSYNLSIQLVQEYEKRPQLWDSQNEFFRVNSAKYDAWMELAQIFNCDIADVRKKLNSIFASHRREKAKVRSGARSTWFLYPYMKFKRPGMENDDDFMEKRYISSSKRGSRQKDTDTESEETEGDIQFTQEDQDDDDDIPTIIIKQEPVTVHSTIDRPQKVFYMDQRPKKNRLVRGVDKRRKIMRRVAKPKAEIKQKEEATTLDHRLLETLKLLRKSDLMKKKDDCDSFGEYIANSLRKHDDKTQSMIKQAINNILFEQEMKKYSECTVVLAVDENPLT